MTRSAARRERKSNLDEKTKARHEKTKARHEKTKARREPGLMTDFAFRQLTSRAW
jgi:hypothetical protein